MGDVLITKKTMNTYMHCTTCFVLFISPNIAYINALLSL